MSYVTSSISLREIAYLVIVQVAFLLLDLSLSSAKIKADFASHDSVHVTSAFNVAVFNILYHLTYLQLYLVSLCNHLNYLHLYLLILVLMNNALQKLKYS